MAEEINKRPFTLVSYTEGNPPIGVSLVVPASQFIHVNAPVHSWTAHRVGKTTYHLSVKGYPFVGVEDGKVIASIHQHYQKLWKITPHKFQNAYTIELADKPGFGWTIPFEAEQPKEIVIGPIIVKFSEPPQFVANQLFLLKHSHNLDDE